MKPDPLCPRCDDVVAHFLDGDPEVRTLAAREDLDEHCGECSDCRAALARARRLDALLARGARREQASTGVVERWLDAAVLAGTAVPAEPPPRRVRPRVLVATILVLVAVVGAGVELSREAPLVEPDRVVAAAIRDAQVADPVSPSDLIPLASRPSTARPPVRPAAPTVAALIEIADGTQWAPVALSIATAVVRDGWSARADTMRSLRDSLRRTAMRELLARRGSAGIAAFAGLIAGTGERDVLAAARAVLAAEGLATRRLGRLVAAGAPAALAAAARLGGAELDGALLERADGALDRTLAVVDDLRAPRTRPGRTDLLLGLWRGVVAKGRLADEVAFAQRLFVRLPDADALAVLERLRGSAAADERARCILALAILQSPMATSALRELLAAPNRDEAALAAFALGRYPPGSDDLADHAPIPADARSLWFAALASRGDPAAREAVRRLSVSAEEREFLLHGGFTSSQTAIAARLFRERGRRID